MWNPRLHFVPSYGFSALVALLHFLAVAGIALTSVEPGNGFTVFHGVGVSLVLISMLYAVSRQGLLKLGYSVRKIWLTPRGWMIEYQNRQRRGPFLLHSNTRLDRRFIRLSFRGRFFLNYHFIVTPTMVGPESFRRLQVFLRWSPAHNLDG